MLYIGFWGVVVVGFPFWGLVVVVAFAFLG